MIDGVIEFVRFIVDNLLTLIIWIVIAYAIMSWLIGFQVINLRNPTVSRIARTLEAIVNPLLSPFRRILPSMAGLDFSPVILMIVVIGVQRYLVPPFFAWLHMLVGAPVAV